MGKKRKPQAKRASKLKTSTSSRLHGQGQKKDAFELLRLRREGSSWKDAEKISGITRRKAGQTFPRAFFRDERGQLQVHGYDDYTRRMKIQTSRPGEFKWLSVRGSHKASLVAIWNNAVKAAGRGEFSLIDNFPRGVVVGGYRLPTSHKQVSRIAAAAAEGDKPFEDIYAMTRAA